MATRYLGPQIDIHGGGADLIFPHHACEISQSERASGKQPFAHYWMHPGLVWLDGDKMSKSLGNLIFARDALQQHSADTLRWYLLSNPYRAEFNYERDKVHTAATQINRLCEAIGVHGGSATPLDLSEGRVAFDAALADDLNTPQAEEILRSMAATIIAAAAEGRDVQAAQGLLTELAGVLGLTCSGINIS
jgi:L-cysteine:1D-myo-inositol 2-amino-2-deoxy-alpha-D-glucopyranoside ligase